VKPTDVGPNALDAGAIATAAPNVEAPRPAQVQRVAAKGPDGPAAGEMTAAAARQGTPAAGSPGPVDVRAAVPAGGRERAGAGRVARQRRRRDAARERRRRRGGAGRRARAEPAVVAEDLA